MTMTCRIQSILWFLVASLDIHSAWPDEVHLAVAANFAPAMKALQADFAQRTGHRLLVSTGSTGQLYAQIKQGAAYQVYLAADTEFPARAIEAGLAVRGTRFPYAVGKLVLYSAREPALIRGADSLLEGNWNKLAIADPQVAPYGKAAIQVLKKLDAWSLVANKLVRGRNVSQTMNFIVTGNAELGFVSLSQVIQGVPGKYWVVPDTWHDPLRQDAVLLLPGKGQTAAQDFLTYLQSEPAAAILNTFGYGVPWKRSN